MEIVWRVLEEIVIGLMTGFAAAILFWAYMIRIFPPRLAFFSRIRESNDPGGIVFHQVKLENIGRRNIIDVHVMVRLTMHYAFKRKIIDLKLDTDYIPYIKPGEKNAKLVRIHPESNSEFAQLPFDVEIQNRAKSGGLLLTDLLSPGEPVASHHAPSGPEIKLSEASGDIEVIVFASDQHSLTRKVFISPIYRKSETGGAFGDRIVIPQPGFFATVFGRSPVG